MALLGDEPRWDYPGNIMKAIVVLTWVAIFAVLFGAVVWALVHAFL